MHSKREAGDRVSVKRENVGMSYVSESTEQSYLHIPAFVSEALDLFYHLNCF